MTFLILLVALLRHRCVQCYGRSMIWDKDRQAFMDLQNMPGFDALRRVESSVERDVDMIDLRGVTLRASYYEERDLIMFYDNDTKMTGIYGDIWNLLAKQLNFTLIPVRCKERNFGKRLENGSYSGLMGLIDRNETQVILRTGYYTFYEDLLDYTIPISTTKYRLYIKSEFGYDNRWMVTMFAPSTWYAIIFLFLVLSLAGYVLQNKQREKGSKKTDDYFGLDDHIFYTFSTMCGQGYLPEAFHNQNKILSISRSMFAWLIVLCFSSNLIYRMTNRTMIPPFSNYETLFNKSKYDLMSFRGSMIYKFVKDNVQHSSYKNNDLSRRVHFVDDPRLMYQNVCYGRKLYALLESEDKLASRGRGFCRVIPIGESYYQTWIGFGLAKHLPYKRVINKSLMKLQEVGLMNVLKDRWLNYRKGNIGRSPFKTIDMDQVYLILIIPFVGVVLSLVILSFENIVFIYKIECK